jgi:alkanesulfonate monooxygenase SsuD/methylene tetrahydromethanopterin reductase-like flavin-dependent oxidoreductase (luciferase family)
VNGPIRLGVAIPQTFPDGVVDTTRMRAVLARAEALGFHSAWTIDQVLGTLPALDSVETLTWAAAVTERIRLGSAVVLPLLRGGPVHQAKLFSTLDQLSRGRLILGVGLGGFQDIYAAYGLPVERRAARFAELLGLMKRLWTEREVTVKGEFWTLERARMEPKPLQRPHPPLWFGGHHPGALRRAVELGDGFLGAGSSSLTTFHEEIDALRRLLDETRRDPATFGVGKRVYIALDADRARAQRRLDAWFTAFYGRPLAEKVAVYGAPEACAEALRALAQRTGATFFLLHAVYDEAEHVERLAAEVAPRLA